MGLDMYLYRAVKDANGEAAPFEKGTIAKWRKNWALHDFINKTFDGNDQNPLQLELNREQVGRIIEAMRSGELKSADRNDLQLFEEAAEWLVAADATMPRILYYMGDW